MRGMLAKDRYDRSRSDYEYLCKLYGDIYDKTGGFVEGDEFMRLLRDPTKHKADKIYCSMIEYGLYAGFSIADKVIDIRKEKDERTVEIVERYS